MNQERNAQIGENSDKLQFLLGNRFLNPKAISQGIDFSRITNEKCVFNFVVLWAKNAKFFSDKLCAVESWNQSAWFIIRRYN